MKFKRGGTDPPSTPPNDYKRFGPEGTPLDEWIQTPSNNDERVGPEGTPLDNFIPTPLSNNKTKTRGTYGTEYDTYKRKIEKRKAEKRRARSRGITKKRPRQISF